VAHWNRTIRLASVGDHLPLQYEIFLVTSKAAVSKPQTSYVLAELLGRLRRHSTGVTSPAGKEEMAGLAK
jgi:hypothetical protein